MGYWGMGITQSDEFCEVYERFIEEYDEGKPLSDIKADILEEYSDGFDKNDEVLHDVFFAIGKAEWMCGGISDDTFEIIADIIKLGKNIAFYKSLEVTERDLKLRQRNLEKFLTLLSTPREKTRKRKVPTDKYIKAEKVKLPAFNCGDVFAYEVNGKYRLICFASKGKFVNTYASYCFAWKNFYEQIPTIEYLTNEYILPLGYFTVETFPKMENMVFVGNNPKIKELYNVFPSVICEQWKPATYAIEKVKHLEEDYPLDLCVKFTDCIKTIEKIKASISTK